MKSSPPNRSPTEALLAMPDILDTMGPLAFPSTKPAAAYPSPKLDRVAHELAQFRYALRKFLRFSELAARNCGVTPQQHQLMLGVEGYSGRGSATISELAEFLQERHHSVVGLVDRAAQRGLVVKTQDAADRRVVNVSLMPAGRKILMELVRLHYHEAKRLHGLWGTCDLPAVSAAARKKASLKYSGK